MKVVLYFQPPTKRLYTHHVYGPLDLSAMREAATYLIGEHDFKAFCSAHSYVKTTIRTIDNIVIEQHGRQIDLIVCGNGFLYNMVRIIAGTLIEIGQGQYGPQEVPKMLAARDRKAAGQTAPAKGLCLVGYQWI